MLQLYYDKLESVIEEKVWIEAFKLFFDKYKINTLKRVAAFVSQASYESLEFRCVEENLNYSRNNLMILFPAHFNNQVIAEAYMHKENSIANRIYAYRLEMVVKNLVMVLAIKDEAYYISLEKIHIENLQNMQVLA
jgi:predicted chitinase